MKKKSTLFKSLTLCAGLLAFGSVQAQFSGDFDPANWTYFSLGPNGDGYMDVSGAPGSIIMYGNNSSAGDPGTLYDDYSITMLCPGDISFDYNHVNPDIDDAWYTINGTEYSITNGGAGSLSGITVALGDVFSFRIKTYDDCCGQGVLTISNFVFSPGGSGSGSVLGSDFSLCPSDSHWISAPAGGGYTYLWNDASTNDSLLVSAAGQYYVFVDQGGGCTYSDTVDVTITSAINFTSSTDPICMGDPVLGLSASPSTNPNPSISTQGVWSGTGVSSSGLNLDTIKVFDFPGSGVEDSLTFGGDLCVEGITVIQNMTSPSFMLANSASLIDSISFTVYHTSCDASYDWNIYVNGVLVETITGIYPNTCSCTPGTNFEVVTSSNPAIQTNWNFGGANTIAIEYTGFSSNIAGAFAEVYNQGNIFDPNVAGPGTHTISYNVCNLSDSFDLIVMDSVAIIATGPAFLCNGAEVELTSNIAPGLGYSSWSTGETTDTIFASNAGIYVLTNTYCGTTDSYEVIFSPDVVTTATITNVVSGNDGAIDVSVFGGTPGFTYSWDSGQSTEDISGISAGTYVITVVDANGCTDSLTIVIGTVDVNNIDGSFGISVYPNPTNGLFNLNIDSKESHSNVNINIINTAGQIVFTNNTNIVSGQNNNEFDLSEFESGIYIIKVTADDYVYITRISLR